MTTPLASSSLPRSQAAGPEHTSLDQRLGALQMVRAGIVGLAFAAAATVPERLGVDVHQVLLPSFAYLSFCFTGQILDHLWRKLGRPKDRAPRSGAPFQQLLLPLDSLYLAVLAVPSGGAESDFIWLFAVQLISATLLGSPRTGVRLAMWDSAVLAGITVLSLGGPVGQMLGVPHVQQLSAAAVGVRISGFWAIALCTAWFSALSERELRRSKYQLDALTTMASEMEQALQAGSDAGEIEVIALRSILAPFDFKRGAVIWERGGRVTLARASAGQAPQRPEELPASMAPLASPFGERALAANEPVLVRRAPAATEQVADRLLPGAVNLVMVGLRAEPGRHGLLLAELGPPLGRLVSRRSLEMMSRFASHLALALSNADLREEVAKLAATDSLTGLANRRAFTEALRKEVARAARSERPLSIAILDIDHFKKINDTLGHIPGDEVLCRVAEAIASHVRDIDVVARYGGEEFAIVLPDCGPEGALTVVERVRCAVASLGTVTKVTLSAGVATASSSAPDEASLVAAADEALYVSKRSGRDRVTLAPGPLWREAV